MKARTCILWSLTLAWLGCDEPAASTAAPMPAPPPLPPLSASVERAPRPLPPAPPGNGRVATCCAGLTKSAAQATSDIARWRALIETCRGLTSTADPSRALWQLRELLPEGASVPGPCR